MKAAAIAAWLLFVWLAGMVAAESAIGFDEPVRAAVHWSACAPMTSFMRGLSALGEPRGLLWLGLGAITGMLARRWHREAVAFLIILLGAAVFDPGLKAVFHRHRPESFFGTPLPGSYSFPSGHAIFAVCFFCGLALLAAPHAPGRRARVAIWTAGVVIAGLIGLSRIYLGVHYPSDVLAGFAVASAWVLGVGLLRREPAKPA